MFGRNRHQELHAFRHVIEANLDVARVRLLILQDLESKTVDLNAGLHCGEILLEGVLLEYRAFKFEDSSINVGRITLI